MDPKTDLKPDAPKPAAMKTWLRVVFGLSLALNLMVVGIVAGSHLKWGGKDRGPMGRLEQMGGPLTRALSHRDRHEIARDMRQNSHGSPEAKAQRRAAFVALIADLRTDPFDREAVAGHMARQRSAMGERMAYGQGLLLERLEKMSAEERTDFADRLQQGLDRRRDRK